MRIETMNAIRHLVSERTLYEEDKKVFCEMGASKKMGFYSYILRRDIETYNRLPTLIVFYNKDMERPDARVVKFMFKEKHRYMAWTNPTVSRTTDDEMDLTFILKNKYVKEIQPIKVTVTLSADKDENGNIMYVRDN